MTMSSSNPYEPEEVEEVFDSNGQLKYSKSNIRVPSRSPSSSSSSSSLASQSSRLSTSSSEPEQVVEQDSRVSGERIWRVIESLREKLSMNSVQAYTGMFDDIVKDATPGAVHVTGAGLRKTQNGIVTWEAREKEVLFNTLDRKGKNGIKEIADAIGSKSELEVLDYLKLVHKGMERQHLLSSHSRAIVLGDVMAAAEISQECCNALEEYSYLLCLRDQISVEVEGKKKHKYFWLVNATMAEDIDRRILSQKRNNNDDTSALPDFSIFQSANLFYLPKWIRLSERFFMNPGTPRLEDNWSKIAVKGQTPSVTADAFSDFYSLTVSITRRLVQTCLFMAMSRIRNMRESGHRKAQVVRARDVKAALDVLNMKHDDSDFWPGMAKRCSLDVADIRHRKGYKSRYLSYNEVEDRLSGKIQLGIASSEQKGKESEDDHSEDMAATDEQIGQEENDDDEGEEEGEEEEEEEDEQDDNNHAERHSSLDDPISENEEEQQSDLEDEHAESVDQKTNLVEERRLWDLLERPAPPYIQPIVKTEDEEDTKTMRKPTGGRKTRQDLVDWRDITPYQSEWERYGYEVFEINNEIGENRRKRRRVENIQPSLSFSTTAATDAVASTSPRGDTDDISTDLVANNNASDSHGSESASNPEPTPGKHPKGKFKKSPVMDTGDEDGTANPIYENKQEAMDVNGPEFDNDRDGRSSRDAGIDVDTDQRYKTEAFKSEALDEEDMIF